MLLAPVSFGLMLVALGLWHRYHSLGQVVVLGLVYIVVSAICVNALFESGFGLYRLAMTAQRGAPPRDFSR